nr:pollen-specific leucine-rich repeat extensin-like protein 3 [Procambarus clarkii]
MMLVLTALCLSTVVGAESQETYSSGDQQFVSRGSYEQRGTKYDYKWAVNEESSNAEFDHKEARDDNNIKGSYSVQLPDGRVQTVTYYVNGDSGYVAEVTYQGEARYPESDEAPVYTPPRPRYSAPESKESDEAPVYIPPRPRYSAPESKESDEAPVYIPPRPRYSVPEAKELQETPVLTTPRPRSSADEPEVPVKTPPRFPYTAPESNESPEAPIYTLPKRLYTALDSNESN